MDNKIIQDLENLLKEEDTDKLKELKSSIVNHLHAMPGKADRVLQKVNVYIDTPNPESREGVETIISELKKQ